MCLQFLLCFTNAIPLNSSLNLKCACFFIRNIKPPLNANVPLGGTFLLNLWEKRIFLCKFLSTSGVNSKNIRSFAIGYHCLKPAAFNGLRLVTTV
jgi:hypothetical protein